MSVERHPTEDLPAFALGALDEPERLVVAAHVDGCEVCTRDLAAFQDALYEAAAIGAVQVDPPAALRDRIVGRHRVRTADTASWLSRLGAVLRRPIPLAVPAALVVLLVVTFALVAGVRQQSDSYAQALRGVADGRVVALAPTEGNPDARASLVIPTKGSPYLLVRLPPPPSGKTWEAWVLRQPGPVPVPAGTSEAGDVFVLPLTAPFNVGDGVAITLEPIAGSAQPTTQPVLALAKT